MANKRLGMLTCDKLKELYMPDQKLKAMLIENGVLAEAVVWDDPSIDWSTYDALLFRNTWDYFEKEIEFTQWLDKIEQIGVPTFNSIDIIKYNVNKFYLRDLSEKGIDIIPTVFIEKNTDFDLLNTIPQSWKCAVIKPAFSAGSYLTSIVDKDNADAKQLEYKLYNETKDLLLQKYMPEITLVGETSLLFFDNEFSHSVCKMPKEGDFRVQSQFGGLYQSTQVSEDIIAQAKKILTYFNPKLLYARVDGIIIDEKFYLMEVELIEPDLYLDHNPQAYDIFVKSIITRLNELA
jgi:glutathione synthase/RimK-type ligase-like ATP-grasp enzyme